jgi:hypothetical protein
MVQGYISPAAADRIAHAKRRLFETSMELGRHDGRTISLILWRDEDAAPPAGQVGPQEVLVVVGGGSRINRGDAAQVSTSQGQFRKKPTFDVRLGDRFTLPETFPGLGGVSGFISAPPVNAGAYIRATFTLEG